MTEEQAARIIALLESIDKRLEGVINGGDSVDVMVQNNQLTVETDCDRPLAVYEPRS